MIGARTGGETVAGLLSPGLRGAAAEITGRPLATAFGEEDQLTAAAEHLHRMAHQIVWLNPLLRFDGFQPRAAGVRALLPHVDRFLPVHNLASLADLGRALRAPAMRPSQYRSPG